MGTGRTGSSLDVVCKTSVVHLRIWTWVPWNELMVTVEVDELLMVGVAAGIDFGGPERSGDGG